MKRFKALPVSKPKRPLRVGVVGEYYSIMDPFSSHDIEREMAKMGVVVERWMNISNSLFHYPKKEIQERIRGYAKYNMGATSMSTIERALRFAKRGYDGIIHLKSFGCTPEMDAMPVLQNISADYNIPILYFSFDSQTADTGIQTRLEAFYDMMTMRKGANK
jgi:predicted nucleotide-binding protein (sugar kinase/HSP70/actin superfamily)